MSSEASAEELVGLFVPRTEALPLASGARSCDERDKAPTGTPVMRGGLPEGCSSSCGDSGPEAAPAPAPPAEFLCPIGMCLMRDPTVVPTGQVYERCFIEAWLEEHSTCPTTGQRLQRPVPLVPVFALRSMIERWARKHSPWLLDREGHVLTPLGQPGCEAPLPKSPPAAAICPVAPGSDRARGEPGGAGADTSTSRSTPLPPSALPSARATPPAQPPLSPGPGNAATLAAPPSPVSPHVAAFDLTAAGPLLVPSHGRLPRFSPAPLVLPPSPSSTRGAPAAPPRRPHRNPTPDAAGRSTSAAAAASAAAGSPRSRLRDVPRLSAAPLLTPNRSGHQLPGNSNAGTRVARREGGFTVSHSASPRPESAGPNGATGSRRSGNNNNSNWQRESPPSPLRRRSSSLPHITAAPLMLPPEATRGSVGSMGSGGASRRGSSAVLPPAVIMRRPGSRPCAGSAPSSPAAGAAATPARSAAVAAYPPSAALEFGPCTDRPALVSGPPLVPGMQPPKLASPRHKASKQAPSAGSPSTSVRHATSALRSSVDRGVPAISGAKLLPIAAEMGKKSSSCCIQ